jgi:hypothetical protein
MVAGGSSELEWLPRRAESAGELGRTVTADRRLRYLPRSLWEIARGVVTRMRHGRQSWRDARCRTRNEREQEDQAGAAASTFTRGKGEPEHDLSPAPNSLECAPGG